jgi:cytochrome c oxidase assembly factor CtaG
MASALERTATRVLAGIIGVLCLWPLKYVLDATLRRPSRERVTEFAILVFAAVVWLALWPRWNRWPRLKPGNRIAILFLSAYIAPIVLLSVVGAEHVEDYVLFTAATAFAVATLWWATVGHRLDPPPG